VPEVSTRLHVADGQYWIWDPAADLALPEEYDGLIAATARLAVVRTGTHTGWVVGPRRSRRRGAGPGRRRLGRGRRGVAVRRAR
jgi:hypothetical protein